MYSNAKDKMIIALFSSVGIFSCSIAWIFNLDNKSNAENQKAAWELRFNNFVNEYRKGFRWVALIIIITIMIFVAIELRNMSLWSILYLVFNIFVPIIGYQFVKDKKLLFFGYWLISFVVGYLFVLKMPITFDAKSNEKISFIYKDQVHGEKTDEKLIYYGYKMIVTKDSLNEYYFYPTDQISNLGYRPKSLK